MQPMRAALRQAERAGMAPERSGQRGLWSTPEEVHLTWAYRPAPHAARARRRRAGAGRGRGCRIGPALPPRHPPDPARAPCGRAASRPFSSRRRPGPSSTCSCPRSSIGPARASRSADRRSPIPTCPSCLPPPHPPLPPPLPARPAGALSAGGRTDSHHRTSQVRSGLGLTSPFQPCLAERSPMLASLPPAVQAAERCPPRCACTRRRCRRRRWEARLERRLSDLANLSLPARGGRGPPRSQQDGRGPEPALDHIPDRTQKCVT